MLLCRYLLLCEYASINPRGQVTLHGLFNRINAIDFPASYQPFSVTIELTALHRAVVDEELAIWIVALDGSHEEVVLETEPYRVCIEAGQNIGMTLDIGRPIFEEPGDYRVRLMANRRPLAFRDLTVCHIGRPAEM